MIGYVGRLLEIKGVVCLVEIMRYLPEYVHLLIVGSGPEERNLRTTASKYGLENRIHFMGNVSYAQLPHYINCMDVGIVPSKTTKRWKEQFGRALVEFMSCEVPVIGSDSGSIPEVLGEAGCIFHENNLQELVQWVTMFLVDPEKRKEFGQIGRERAIAYYSTGVMNEHFLSIYRKLM